MFLPRRKAQIAAEYAALLAIIAASLMAMKIYFQRAVQGKVKALADQVSPYQYNPESSYSRSQTTSSGSGTFESKALSSTVAGEESSTRTWEEYNENDVIEK